jgi:Polyketide cyclase / dehydrase and lipid transport
VRFSHTLKTAATPGRIWEIWTDVKNWAQWDTELITADLDGAFVLGAIGRLKPKTGGVTKFEISQFNPGNSYTFAIGLPLCSLQVHRYLSDRVDGTYFTHEVSFQGWLGWLFGLLLGRKFRSVLPSVMANLERIANS